VRKEEGQYENVKQEKKVGGGVEVVYVGVVVWVGGGGGRGACAHTC